jgi:hypothetical protein
MNSVETSQDILEARKKMAEKFVNTKIGGKGIKTFNKKKGLKEERKYLNTKLLVFKIRKFNL